MAVGTHNGVVHLELLTGDLAGARSYYGELCGWEAERIDTAHGAYTALAMGERLGGGIVECAIERPLWLPYAEVPDIRAATARAVSLGGRLMLAPREGPAGWRSVVGTPAGGQMAFWQAKR